MDLGRVLGGLLGGALNPPRRRRRTTSPLGSRTSQAQLGRAIGTIAGAAIEAMMRGSQQPAPPPPPRTPPRLPGRWGEPVAAPANPWSRPATPPPPPEAGPAAEDVEALLLIRTMVAAAKADGAVDADERKAIAGQLDAAGLDAAERDFVLADFDRPLTPEALAQQAGDPMLRARLYAAAVAVLDDITPPERAWLDRLAHALGLDRAAAAAIERKLQA